MVCMILVPFWSPSNVFISGRKGSRAGLRRVGERLVHPGLRVRFVIHVLSLVVATAHLGRSHQFCQPKPVDDDPEVHLPKACFFARDLSVVFRRRLAELVVLQNRDKQQLDMLM